MKLRHLTLAILTGLALTCLTTATVNATDRAARHGMSSGQYQVEFNKYTSQGYRLADVSSYIVAGKPLYAAIWIKKGGPACVARHGMTSGSYQDNYNTYTSQGFVPAQVDGMSGDRFAARWEKSGGTCVARHGMTGASYQAEFNKWTSKGYRLVDISGYQSGGQARYAAIWKKQGGPAWVARHGMTDAQYQAAFNQYTAQGFKPAHVDGYTVRGKAYYAAIWTKAGGIYAARHGMSSAGYQAEFNKWTSKGYRLVDVSGYSAGGQVKYAAIWYK